MRDNARFYLSMLWLVLTGCVVASALIVLITWGDHTELLFASLGAWVFATAGTILLSL